MRGKSHCGGGRTQQGRVAAETRSGRRWRQGDSQPGANWDSICYCTCVYTVPTLLIPKYTVYTFGLTPFVFEYNISFSQKPKLRCHIVAFHDVKKLFYAQLCFTYVYQRFGSEAGTSGTKIILRMRSWSRNRNYLFNKC